MSSGIPVGCNAFTRLVRESRTCTTLNDYAYSKIKYLLGFGKRCQFEILHPHGRDPVRVPSRSHPVLAVRKLNRGKECTL